MTEEQTTLPPASEMPVDLAMRLDRNWALFLDLDGTLFHLAPTPQDVHPDDRLTRILAEVARRFDGALAIVSGRPIAQIDALMGGLVLPAAGLHGQERRDAHGRLHEYPVDVAALHAVRLTLQAFASTHSGVLLEDKGRAIALHYRLRPELHREVQQLVAAAVAPHGGLVLQPGKMVVEVKPRGVSKGGAIAQFLAEPPFVGRRPLFAGDDVTDEDAFALVRSLDGLSIRVGGTAPTLAHERIDSVDSFRGWLAGLIDPGPSGRRWMSERP